MKRENNWDPRILEFGSIDDDVSSQGYSRGSNDSFYIEISRRTL
jgi:hypothetical protein